MKKNPARLKSLMAMVQSHEKYLNDSAMNPGTNPNEIKDSSNFSSFGTTHNLINDSRTRILLEICRRLELASVEYTNVDFNLFTTEYLKDMATFISSSNDEINFSLQSIECITLVSKYQNYLIKKLL